MKALFYPLILISFAGMANSAMDTLQFHYPKSVFRKLGHESFWNPNISWKNKWRDGIPLRGEKFLGSSTVFVGFTDGWHLCKKLMLLSVVATVVTYRPSRREWIFRVVDFVLLYLAFTIAFELCFRWVWV